MARTEKMDMAFSRDLPEATLRVLRAKLPPAEIAEYIRLQTRSGAMNAAERRRSFAILEAADLTYEEIDRELVSLRRERAARAEGSPPRSGE